MNRLSLMLAELVRSGYEFCIYLSEHTRVGYETKPEVAVSGDRTIESYATKTEIVPAMFVKLMRVLPAEEGKPYGPIVHHVACVFDGEDTTMLEIVKRKVDAKYAEEMATGKYVGVVNLAVERISTIKCHTLEQV